MYRCTSGPTEVHRLADPACGCVFFRVCQRDTAERVKGLESVQGAFPKRPAVLSTSIPSISKSSKSRHGLSGCRTLTFRPSFLRPRGCAARVRRMTCPATSGRNADVSVHAHTPSNTPEVAAHERIKARCVRSSAIVKKTLSRCVACCQHTKQRKMHPQRACQIAQCFRPVLWAPTNALMST